MSEFKYFYKEDTNNIYLSGSILTVSESLYNQDYNALLVPTSSAFAGSTYTTSESIDIPIRNDNELWVFGGYGITDEDENLFQYNRYLHRPYKAYVLVKTGSLSSDREFEKVYLAYSSSVAENRPDGLYIFDQVPTQDLEITVSVSMSSYEGTSRGPGGGTNSATWPTASLNLYLGNFPVIQPGLKIASASLYDLEINSGSSLILNHTLDHNILSPGDSLSISLSVSSGSFSSTIVESGLTVTDYKFEISPSTEGGVTPTYFENVIGFSRAYDCQPTINNITEFRSNGRLQDVDYSVDVLNPVNFDLILKDQAVRATVPESNYSQLSSILPKYVGSSTTREMVNKYIDSPSSADSANYNSFGVPGFDPRGKGPRLGKIPNVEVNDAYIVYFNKIIDPYPVLNNKVAYYVKYLIDESGTIFDPTLSDINYSILKNTFKLYDYNLINARDLDRNQRPEAISTNVNTSIQNIDEAKELSKLNEGLSPTFKVGQYPIPILYTQTSSIGHVNEIPLSGSRFYTALGIGENFSDWGLTAKTTQSVSLPANNLSPIQTTSTSEITFLSTDIILSDPVLGTSSFQSLGEFAFQTSSGLTTYYDTYGDPPNTAGGLLSDTYQVKGTYKLYTTSLPADYERVTTFLSNSPEDNRKFMMDFSLKVLQKDDITNPSSTYSTNTNGFSLDEATLNIYTYNYPEGTPDYSSPTIYKIPIPVNVNHGTSGGYLKVIPNYGIRFNLDSQWLLYQIAQSQGINWDTASEQTKKGLGPLIGGGWNGVGYGCSANTTFEVKYEWVFNFTLGTNKNYLKQGSGFKFEAGGSIEDGTDTRNYFLQFDQDGNYDRGTNNIKWRHSFFPTIGSSPTDYKPSLLLTIQSPLSNDSSNQNKATGPFWRKVDGVNNQLFMSSSALNKAYGQPYYQGKLPYNGASNPDFPLTIEPGFIEFDPITEPWSLQVGDEIRFENDEDLVYTITSNKGQKAITTPSDNPDGQLVVTVTPSFEGKQPSNFDFFVVRRYVENRNFIILDQQMPYGFAYGKGTVDYSGEDIVAGVEPVTQASSPGILLPEHRIEVYNRNPDEVLKDLIEKNII